MNKKLNFVIYGSILILTIILVRDLINFSNILKYYPLHMEDLCNHIPKVLFLKEYGFYGNVPNWYNGFILFKSYPPGWALFTYLFYYLSNNLLLATFLSLISIYILGFIGFFILGKIIKISIKNRILIFLLFFANPLAIIYIRMGRLPELFSWVVFLFLFIGILIYKDKKINWKFFMFVFIASFLLLTHIYTFIISLFVLLSLFLVKKNKGKFLIILFLIITFLLTMFWWKPFLDMSSVGPNPNSSRIEFLSLGFSLQALFSFNTIILIGWFLIFYFYWISNGKNKRDLLFYSPILFLSLMLISRLIIFIPILSEIPINPYNMFFILMSLTLLFKVDYTKINKKFESLIIIGILIFSLASLYFVLEINKMPDFKYTQSEEDAIKLFPQIKDKFMILDLKSISMIRSVPLISYATIYYNLSSAQGTYTEASAGTEIMIDGDKIRLYDLLSEMGSEFVNKNCDKLITNLKLLGVKEVLSFNNGCSILYECGLIEKSKEGTTCLYLVI